MQTTNDDVQASMQPAPFLERDTGRISRRHMLGGTGATLAALGLLGTTGFGNPGIAQADEAATITSADTASTKPVIVLVHGAWADGSCWSKVIKRLQNEHYTVVAPAVSLSSLSADIAALSKVITDLGAPVLLVGHSYGGAVITGAASGLANVKGLIYLAGWAIDQGESLFSLGGQFTQQYGDTVASRYFRPDGPLDADHLQTLIYLDRANFGTAFVQDIDRDDAAVLGTTQRPPTLLALSEPLQVEPAWRTIRSWYQVSTRDHAIQPQGERWMAKRMGAEVIELSSSHPAMIPHPQAIVNLIKKAAKTVG